MIKTANTKYAVNELIKNRWSPRSFLDKQIREDVLLSLFEAASWAASARNEQPWSFICGIKSEGRNYDKVFKTLVEANQRWAKSAPVLGIGLARKNYQSNNKPNLNAQYDLGQALAMLSIQAISNNLYVHQMGGFDKEIAKEIFRIPSDYEPIVAFAIGYLGLPESLPDDIRETEEKPRTRNNLDKFLFFDELKL